MTAYSLCNADQVAAIAAAGGTIVDVRTPQEHAEKRLKADHLFIPLGDLNAQAFLAQHDLPRDRALYILCKGGTRAKQAAQVFIDAGCTNIHVIDGGLMACEASGTPTHSAAPSACGCTPSTSISLERQVRIAAGAFAAIGALLGLCVSPGFTLIPLFVGCGLIFAGITDRCGMALVLAKAPWNRLSKNEQRS